MIKDYTSYYEKWRPAFEAGRIYYGELNFIVEIIVYAGSFDYLCRK